MLFEDIKLDHLEIVAPTLVPPDFVRLLARLEEGLLTPLHGRSVSLPLGECEWLSIKGVGWTKFFPSVLRSRKDAQLAFGVYGAREARREAAVSKRLLQGGVDGSQVIAWGTITAVKRRGAWIDVGTLRWQDNTAVEPAILLTKTKIPARVADLGWFSLAERSNWLSVTKRALAASTNGELILVFAEYLGRNVAKLHLLGAVNDTLEPSNVTLAAEVTDYEWVFVPGVPLPDGTTDVMLKERQWKEVLYGAEVVQQFAWQAGYREVESSAISAYLLAYVDAGGPARRAVKDLQRDFVWD